MNLWSHRFSKNTNKKLSRFLPSLYRAEILTIFCLYFGRNDDFINSFWNCLTCWVFIREFWDFLTFINISSSFKAYYILRIYTYNENKEKYFWPYCASLLAKITGPTGFYCVWLPYYTWIWAFMEQHTISWNYFWSFHIKLFSVKN